MNLAPIIERIRDECPLFLLVGGAAAFERATTEGLTTVPAAFVLPARERAAPSPFMDRTVEQMVDFSFSVAVAVRNLSDSTGAAAVDELEFIRAPLRDALLGWPPADGYNGCEFDTGDFLAFMNGVLWWGDVYRTANVIRSV